MSEHCVNPHEKIYRGCTDMCKYFPECKAKDTKEISEGELKRQIEDKTCYNAGIRKWGTITFEELDKILDKMWTDFPIPSHGIDVKHPLTFEALMKEIEKIEEWFSKWRGKPHEERRRN